MPWRPHMHPEPAHCSPCTLRTLHTAHPAHCGPCTLLALDTAHPAHCSPCTLLRIPLRIPPLRTTAGSADTERPSTGSAATGLTAAGQNPAEEPAGGREMAAGDAGALPGWAASWLCLRSTRSSPRTGCPSPWSPGRENWSLSFTLSVGEPPPSSPPSSKLPLLSPLACRE